MPMTSSTRCSRSATRPCPIDRGLQRLAVAAARVGRAADDVDVAAGAGLQRLLAQDRLGAGVDRLGARVVAAELERLDAGQLAARERHAQLDDRERRGRCLGGRPHPALPGRAPAADPPPPGLDGGADRPRGPPPPGPSGAGRLRRPRRPAGPTAARMGGWGPAPAGAAIDGGRARTLASSATTAAPASAAGTARRATTRPFTSRTLR